MNENKSFSGVSLEEHLTAIRANLACCWIAAQLLSRLQESKKQEDYKRFVAQVLENALRDFIVMAMARLWDKGSTNKDCLSIPNLKSRSDLPLTKDQIASLDKLRAERLIKTADAMRNSFVAHSLATPKIGADNEIHGGDVQRFIERCHVLLSGLYKHNCDYTLSWGEFDEELEKWEKLIKDLEQA
ncbi:MAG: hypothetical protein RI566_00865 [Sediminimonas sp.]|uniref:AbiU2 domain-containing protein n=1 Tax=Sediminimonas sp. TaxID=2823379 RepID=UPI0028707D03|nr:hypothetical protein [Sediminimonas sp.]MDR9483697.1 hypothetical protein [Sediminimonas sp.]